MRMEHEDAHAILGRTIDAIRGLDNLRDKYDVSERDRVATRELLKACRNPPVIPLGTPG